MAHVTMSHADVINFMKDASDFRVNPKTKIDGGVYFNGTGYGQVAPNKTN